MTEQNNGQQAQQITKEANPWILKKKKKKKKPNTEQITKSKIMLKQT